MKISVAELSDSERGIPFVLVNSLSALRIQEMPEILCCRYPFVQIIERHLIFRYVELRARRPHRNTRQVDLTCVVVFLCKL
jgi:hypothetical protein